MRWGRIALWVLALLPSVTIALLSLFIWIVLDAGLFSPMSGDSSSDILTLISAGTLLVSTAGTISTIWLVWRKEGRESRKERGESRKERRESREDTLKDTLRMQQEALKIHTQKIQQLEMQLAELRAKISFTPPVAP